MDWLADYGLFLAKAATVAVLVAAVAALVSTNRSSGSAVGRLRTEDLSTKYRRIRKSLSSGIGSPRAVHDEPEDRRSKRQRKKEDKKPKPTVFVLDFVGDLPASGVGSLQEEISAAILAAHSGDEVLLRLDSPGGSVTGYGLVAAQLHRLKAANIPLTVAVGQVAASGGYLAACVADRILAAPFAIIGSIGVVLQLPNLHRFLKEHNIDFEMITAGKNKRNLTIFGPVEEGDRDKAKEQLESIHSAFVDEVGRYRDKVDVKKVAEGDIWLASKALEMGLVDELGTSDDWLIERLPSHRLMRLQWLPRRPLGYKLVRSMFGRLYSAFTGGDQRV